MEFPFGHDHNQRRDDDEDERNRFPPFPSQADGPEPFHPPPVVHHVSHQPGAGFAPPPTSPEPPPPPLFDLPPPPRPSSFVDDPSHDSRHETPDGREEGHHRSGCSDHASHEGEGGYLNRQPTVRVFTKADENYSLSIRDGKVILARQDPSDEHQHWIKDLRYSTKVKDEESFPAFAPINKATGEAIKHSFGATHPKRRKKLVQAKIQFSHATQICLQYRIVSVRFDWFPTTPISSTNWFFGREQGFRRWIPVHKNGEKH